MMLQSPEPRLVLASGSESRRGLLAAAGLAFSTCSSAISEDAVKQRARHNGATPEATALELARLKAEAVSPKFPGAIVIGCDQLLVCGDRWFDKPDGLEGLRQQLSELQGREHMLVAATVCIGPDRTIWTHVEKPRLRMRPLSAEFMEAYVALEGNSVMACVGGYRLEGVGVHLFEEITGDHSAILGLPLIPLLRQLREWKVLAS